MAGGGERELLLEEFDLEEEENRGPEPCKQCGWPAVWSGPEHQHAFTPDDAIGVSTLGPVNAFSINQRIA